MVGGVGAELGSGPSLWLESAEPKRIGLGPDPTTLLVGPLPGHQAEAPAVESRDETQSKPHAQSG
jgi:hypothetical protein